MDWDKVWHRLKEEHDILQSREEYIAFLKLIEHDDSIYNVLEIGFYKGGIARGIMGTLGGQGHLKKYIAIDIPDHFDRHPDALAIAQAYEQQLPGVFTLLQGKSENLVSRALDLMGEDYIDLLFIDGDHSCEGALRDFEYYQCLVRDGGMIVFHDIYMDTIKAVWGDIRKRYPWTTLMLNQKEGYYGIGIMWKNVEPLPLPDPGDMTYGGV